MKLIVLHVILSLLSCTSVMAQSGHVPPDWAKSAIWYQIFPERFRNGDTRNDPSISDLIGSWPHDTVKEWSVSPWNSDWYKLQSWELKNGKGFYYNAQLRRYGGDLRGIIDKLSYLDSLGVNALYLNPIFESPSLHKYDATYYHHVDNNFGPDPAGDVALWTTENHADPKTWKWSSADSLFLKLIDECHRRNMKIIIDGVFNHTGMTFWALKDLRINGENSAYNDWFTVKKRDDPATPQNEFEYEGWFGIRELPELKEGDHGFAQPVRDHIHAVVKRWMDPNNDGDPSDGIDGWRLDVAHMVHLEFWKEFRKWTRDINPNSYLVGEVWWDDWQNNKMFDPSEWVKDGDVFDAVMNYRLTVPILNYVVDKKNKISSSQFSKRVTALVTQFPADVTQVQMNTLDSHDTDRLPSIIVNPDRWFDHQASAGDNRKYDVRRPTADEIKVQKLVLLLQFTLPGAPSVYYGSESGMWGGDDPDERKPMVWNDFVYETESSHPFGLARPADPVQFDAILFAYYNQLITLRKSHLALSVGSLQFIKTDDANNTVLFERSFDGKKVLVGINNSDLPRTIILSADKKTESYTEVLRNQQVVKDSQKKNLTVTLPPKSGGIYIPVSQ